MRVQFGSLLIMNAIYRLPFVRSFKGKSVFSVPNQISLAQLFLGRDIFQNLAMASKNMMSAIEQNDLPYLKNITTPHLYKFLEQQLDIINSNNLKVKSTLFEMSEQKVNTRQAVEMLYGDTMSNQKKQQMTKLTRHTPFIWENNESVITLSTNAYIGLTMATRKLHKEYKFIHSNHRYYYITPKTLSEIWNYFFQDQLMALFMEINTKNKLYIQNDHGDIIQGESSPEKYVRSIIRFETNSNELDFKITDINFLIHKDTGLELAADIEPNRQK